MAVFAENGSLATTIAGYQAREEQQQLAAAVANSLENEGRLLVEAGTGTGKTFGYLVPAMRWAAAGGRKVIISTGTKHLQDQLFEKDIPVIRRALSLSLRTARLKGRANYICHHRLELAQDDMGLSPIDSSNIERIKAWVATTKNGDLADLDSVAEDWPGLGKVTSTAENCLGADCSAWDDCFVVRARREAIAAQVLVVNHHLLLADMVLRERGFGELLPSADAVIVDEAHQLPEIASNFFGSAVTGRQLNELVRDCRAENHELAALDKRLESALGPLEQAVRQVRDIWPAKGDRLAWNMALAASAGAKHHIERLLKTVSELVDALKLVAERSTGLANCLERSQETQAKLQMLVAEGEERKQADIRWVETFPRSFALRSTPLNVGPELQQHAFSRPAAWVLTSATLTVGRDFKHYADRLGIGEHDELCLDSPFDYAKNSLIYLPENLPDPSARHFLDVLVDASLPVLAASNGRAFMLFTSYRALHIVAKRLADETDYPLFVQGDAPKAVLLERFKQSGNGVLLGTASFWEGVDVRGEALSVVIIDKLPFAAPGDPVLEARRDAMRAEGREPFRELQLPQAVIAMKQGAGRLIRDANDRGVLMVCDIRLKTKGYGKLFLRSLPPMKRTRTLSEVEAFLQANKTNVAEQEMSQQDAA